MKNRSVRKFFADKGFYIALILCLAIIGVGTWAVVEFTDVGQRVTAQLPETGEDVFNPQTPAITPAPNVGEIPESNLEENPESNRGEEPITTQTPAPKQEAKPTPKSFMWPVSGDITMPYSVDALIYNPTMSDWRTHPGIDIATDLGTAVSAIADGTVIGIEKDGMSGTTVTIEHGGNLVSVYSNLDTDLLVSVGDTVEMGDLIGRVGETSISEAGREPHLHLEMTLNGNSVNPLDYLPN
jgi:murein DD-endopeptidase MepM/ murein hydrolase activator NlpD